MSISQYIERMQIRRENIPPIGFVDDDLSVVTYRNQKRAIDSQIGIKLKPNTVEKKRLHQKAWRMKNPGSHKQWLEKNYDRMIVYWREYQRSERGKFFAKRYRENNLEKYNAYQLKWRNANREKIRARENERHKERYQTDNAYKQKKIENGKRAWHAWKARQIELLGVDGFKAMRREKYLQKKEKKNESSKG